MGAKDKKRLRNSQLRGYSTPSRTFVADRARQQPQRKKEKIWLRNKTYSSRDSHVVTHRSTNLPFNCLCMAERTGCPVFS
ncbi:hypothetical protein KCU81_g1881, partial [Aureobasidium melanogenum]